MARNYNKSENEYARMMGIWFYTIIFFICVMFVQLVGQYRNHSDNARNQCQYLAQQMNKDVSYANLNALPAYFDLKTRFPKNPALKNLNLAHWAILTDREVTVSKIEHVHNFIDKLFEREQSCSIDDLASPGSPVSKYQLSITTQFLPNIEVLIWILLTSLVLTVLPLYVFSRMSNERNADKKRLKRFFSLIVQRDNPDTIANATEAESVQKILDNEGQHVIQFIDQTKELNERIDPDYINRLEKNFIDLEERNAHLAIRNKELNRQTTMKSSFFANLSHDFRTPLYTIDGYSKLLLETELERKQLSHVNAVQTANANLLELVSNFLSLSRLEAGKIDLDYSDLDLRQLIEDISSGLTFLSAEHRDHIFIDIGEALPNLIETDTIKLRQILANLISNAVKYTYDGVIYIRVECRKVGEDTSAINISISDTGKGIPEQDLLTIFDPYTRLNRDKTQIHGTGLGLGICKELCEVIGAKLSVNSKEGHGSTFSIDMTSKIRAHHHEPVYAFVKLGYKLHVFNSAETIQDFISEWIAPIDVSVTQHTWKALIDSPELMFIKHGEKILVILDYAALESLAELAEKLKTHGKNVIICGPLNLLNSADLALLEPFITVNNNLSNYALSKYISYQELENKKPDIALSKSPLKNFVLLLAEDNDLNRKIIEERLHSFGAQVISCPDGSAALELYKARSYSAILMDAHMPKISGTQLTEIIRHDFNDTTTPIIGITASTSTVEYKHYIQSGMTDCLIKPLQDKELIASILKFASPDITNEEVDDKSPKNDVAEQEPVKLSENSIQQRIDILSLDSIKAHIIELRSILEQADILEKQNALFQEVHKLNGTLSMTSFKELQIKIVDIENLINPMLWSTEDHLDAIILKQVLKAEEEILTIIPDLESKVSL